MSLFDPGKWAGKWYLGPLHPTRWEQKNVSQAPRGAAVPECSGSHDAGKSHAAGAGRAGTFFDLHPRAPSICTPAPPAPPQTQRPELAEEECVTPPSNKRPALGEDGLLDLEAGNTLFNSRGHIILPPPQAQPPDVPQQQAAVPQQQSPSRAVSMSISALMACLASGSQLPDFSPFKEVTQPQPRQPDLLSPGYFAGGDDPHDYVSPGAFGRMFGSGGFAVGSAAEARSGLVDAINAVRAAEEAPQLAPLLVTPDEMIRFHYRGDRYPSILQAPEDLLREVGELKGSTNVYLYLVPERHMLHLAGGFYAMDPRWNENSMRKLVFNEGGKKSFLVNAVKRNLLTAAMDNHTLLLPLHEPINPCTPGWYREKLRNNLVLLCCNDDVTQSRAFKDINCVALGMFVGDQLYSNTLDKTTRFQGRPDVFRQVLDINNQLHGPVDNNQVLAPVHIITTMFRDANVTMAGSLGDAGQGLELPAFKVNGALPYPLELAVADIQAATTTPMDAPGTDRFMQQILGGVVGELLKNEKVRRTTVVDDTDRVDLVTKVLDMVTGALDTDLVNTPIAEANRAEKLAPRDKKRGKDKFGLKGVLQRAASRVEKGMMHPADHYACMAALHAGL